MSCSKNHRYITGEIFWEIERLFKGFDVNVCQNSFIGQELVIHDMFYVHTFHLFHFIKLMVRQA